MAAEVGRADYVLRALLDLLRQDLRQADAEIKATGSKTEQEFAKSSERSVSRLGGMVRNSTTVIAGAATVLFAIATKGTIELDAATKDYAASVGATAEEEKAASSLINRLNAEKRQGYAEIGATLALLRTDMGLTQETAGRLGDRVLDFAKVARQDGPAAVRALDDSTDQYNLTLEDQIRLMDQLAAAQQRGAGPIAAIHDTLNRMAPALKAANLSWEDGIALLVQFGDAGIDASKAPLALQRALSQVKSPEELRRLMADIQATEDDFERARKASELFGSKAGPQMASLLRPGTVSLADRRRELEASTGTVDGMSDKMDEAFGARAAQALKWFGSQLAGVGKEFGPVVTGLASIASLGATLGIRLPGLGRMLGPIGRGLGKLLGAGINEGAGEAVAEGASGTIIRNLSADVVKKGAAAAGAQVGTTYAAGVTSPAVLTGLRGRMAAMLLAASIAAGPTATAAGIAVGSAVGRGIALGLTAALPGILIALNEVYADIFGSPSSTQQALTLLGLGAGKETGKATVQGIGEGMREQIASEMAAFGLTYEQALAKATRDATEAGLIESIVSGPPIMRPVFERALAELRGFPAEAAGAASAGFPALQATLTGGLTLAIASAWSVATNVANAEARAMRAAIQGTLDEPFDSSTFQENLRKILSLDIGEQRANLQKDFRSIGPALAEALALGNTYAVDMVASNVGEILGELAALDPGFEKTGRDSVLALAKTLRNLRDGSPAGAARDGVQAVLDILYTLSPAAGKAGGDATASFGGGMNAVAKGGGGGFRPGVPDGGAKPTSAASSIVKTVTTELAKTVAGARAAGADTGYGLGGGISSTSWYAVERARLLRQMVINAFRGGGSGGGGGGGPTGRPGEPDGGAGTLGALESGTLSALPALGGLAGAISGTVVHEHRISTEGAQALRDAGFDEGKVARALVDFSGLRRGLAAASYMPIGGEG